MYSPSHDEAYYEGSFYDHEPHGGSGAVIRFHYVEESEYTRDPEAELDWMDEVLASEERDKLAWGDRNGRTEVARIVLRHRLGREPTGDEVSQMAMDVGTDWEEGQEWTLFVGDLADRAGL
jgi:hypothetical protein